MFNNQESKTLTNDKITHIPEHIDCPEDVYRVFSFLEENSQEEFYVLCFNAKNEVSGIYHAETASAMEILNPACRVNAKAVIIVHNHPYGNPRPSDEDRRITEKIIEACGTLGIRLHDHVIVSGGKYFSFKRENLL